MIYLTYLFVVVLMVLIDQFTKHLIVTYFALGESISLIDGFFSLTYVRNFGAGFSIMQGQSLFFYIITPIAIIGFVYLLLKSKNIIEKIAVMMMIAGALGNFIDRITTIYVVDFLDFVIFSYDFPVFNIADCFLTVGVFILLICSFLEARNAKN